MCVYMFVYKLRNYRPILKHFFHWITKNNESDMGLKKMKNNEKRGILSKKRTFCYADVREIIKNSRA